MTAPPTPDDVAHAATRLAGRVRRTPVLEDDALNAHLGGRVLIKAECLQTTGSFKLRGAFNRLLAMTEAERARGVVAWSAGNHAQGLAYAGRALGVAVTIVMPDDAPRAKLEGTASLGARLVLHDRVREDREAIGHRIAAETGAIIVPPYEDAHVIAGGGTAGLELIDEAAARGVVLDRIIVCVGGGGLIAGCALAARLRGAAPRMLAAEPVGWDDTRRSLLAGRRISNDPATPASCADALMTCTPGEMTFNLNRALLAGGIAVTEAALAAAVRFAFTRLRLVVEPGGAASLASVLAEAPGAGGATGIILTGGNVDAVRYAALLTMGEAA